MLVFTCNICGAACQVENFATEPASCACGSNVRLRALVRLLAEELFGQPVTLPEFPALKAVRGLGMTDQESYATRLAERLGYANTFYDRAPRFDFTEAHPDLYGTFDFILSADVLEHIAPPVERALDEVFRLLKPNGFFVATVYCNPADAMREHYPGLADYRVARLAGGHVVVNRRADGSVEVFDNPVFHGGSGETLEMREFGVSALEAKLHGVGFEQIRFLTEEAPDNGILFDHDVSQPLVARKAAYSLGQEAQQQLVDAWRDARREAERQTLQASLAKEQLRRAAGSKWMRLGRALGLGPRIEDAR